jgi:hypothetical protein
MKKSFLVIIGMLFLSRAFSQQYVLIFQGNKLGTYQSKADCEAAIKKKRTSEEKIKRGSNILNREFGGSHDQDARRLSNDLQKWYEKQCECKEIKEGESVSSIETVGNPDPSAPRTLPKQMEETGKTIKENEWKAGRKTDPKQLQQHTTPIPENKVDISKPPSPKPQEPTKPTTSVDITIDDSILTEKDY